MVNVPDACDTCEQRPPTSMCAVCEVFTCAPCPCLCVDDTGADDDADDAQDDDDDDDDGPDLDSIRWPG